MLSDCEAIMQDKLKKLVGKTVIVRNATFRFEGTLLEGTEGFFSIMLDTRNYCTFTASEVFGIVPENDVRTRNQYPLISLQG